MLISFLLALILQTASLPSTCTAGQFYNFTGTTPSMLMYCAANNIWERYPTPIITNVTSSNVTTTGQVLTDIAGLSAPLAANATYTYLVRLSVSTSAVTTGTRYGVNFSVAGASVEGAIICSSTTVLTLGERVSALNTANIGVCLATSAQNGIVWMQGVITVGANAGNFTVKHLKITSGTSTVFINSFMEVKRKS